MSEVSSDQRCERVNQESLGELCRLLRFAQGEFAVVLAVCNATQHRQNLVAQLQQQCPIIWDEVTLPVTTPTLFTTLRQQVSDPPPAALMVYGLEMVQELAPVLTATNQIREEFRQFPFPLVLWLSDQGLKQLIRYAPDFYTWANLIAFETPPALFLSFLDDLFQLVWRQVLRSRESHFLSDQELGFAPGSARHRELSATLTALEHYAITLTPVQAADLAFVQGRIANNNTSIARSYYTQSLDLWETLIATAPEPVDPVWQTKRGHVQFYLGLWWRNHAERYRQESAIACQQACRYFQAAVETFEQVERSDLTAKYINYWAESLHRLKRWQALENIAAKALSLHHQQQHPFRTARAEGFLAEVALSQQAWLSAQHRAEAALLLIQPPAIAPSVDDRLELAPPSPPPTAPASLQSQTSHLHRHNDLPPGKRRQLSEDEIAFYRWVNSFHRSWYLFSLGRAHYEQGHVDTAVSTLEKALEITKPEYDADLYSRILEQLRQGYFQQGKYLQAFETRRQREAIQSQFNYRAFIGAGRLQPKQHITNPSLPTEAHPKDVIVTSGRKHDVKHLIQRLSKDENVLTIVYGPSGVGKSSLIEAALVPALEQTRLETRRVVPVYLRRYRDWARELVQALNGASQAVAGTQKTTISTEAETLSASLIGLLRQHTHQNRVIVLLLDQFEEFFFEFEQPVDRRPLYAFLRDCLAAPYIKVVLSLREDYIHHLLECDRLTNLEIIDNNILDRKWLYYLGNFSPEDTRAVITDLTEPTPYSPEPELVEQVVADLAAEAGVVRPIELQIVGAQLQAEGITTPQVYRDWGDPALPTKELLVQQYLKDIVQECGPAENQQMADMVLYLLTDERGIRPLKTESDLFDELCSFTHRTDLNREALSLVLKILTRSGLVMEVPEAPEDRYQLVHDYLAAFLRASQQPWIDQFKQEREKRLAAELKLEKRLITILGVSCALFVVSVYAGAIVVLNNQSKQEFEETIDRQIGITLAVRINHTNDLLRYQDSAAIIEAVKAAESLKRRYSDKRKAFRVLPESKKIPQNVVSVLQESIVAFAGPALSGQEQDPVINTDPDRLTEEEIAELIDELLQISCFHIRQQRSDLMEQDFYFRACQA